MKIAITALAAVVALGTSSIACSSPANQQEVDSGSALSELRSPTGSFSDDTAGSAFGNYRSKRADSSQVSTPSASAGGTSSTQSIRLLDEATSSGSSCRQGDSCACPNGGSFSYTGGSSADGQLVNVSFAACVFEDGFGFDGKAILLVSNKPLLGIASSAPASPAPTAPSAPSDGLQNAQPTQNAPQAGGSAASILLAAKGIASNGSRKLPLEFALVTEAHYAFLAVKVKDGVIVIGVSDSGDAIVRSKEGTWKCHSGTSGWSCTSDSGKTMNVTEQAPSEASVTSGDPSAPAAPSDPSADPSDPSTDTSDAGSSSSSAPGR